MRHTTASSTARLIARCLLLASRDSTLSKLVPPNEAELIESILRQTKGHFFFPLFLLAFPRWILRKAEAAMLPGIIAHYILRKRKIERIIREEIENGTRRIVIVGAGYDTLSLRLHREFPEAEFIEMDHPATQLAKKRAFPEAHNLRYVSTDLSKESIGEIFKSLHESSNGKCAVVIEGLTMYLQGDKVSEMFRDLSLFSRIVIFTFMERSADGSISFRDQSRLIDLWLRFRNEPFLWGMARDDLSGFLSDSGLQCSEIIDHSSLRREFLLSPDLDKLRVAQGECICTAVSSIP